MKKSKTSYDRARRIAEIALSKKGEDIVLLDMRKRSNICDWFVIVSANSSRAVNALAEYIQDDMKKEGHPPIRVDGRHSSYWVLVDYADIIVHVFYKEMRDFYGLETLWADAPQERVEDDVR
jgi:ribosome-associated protein